MVPLRSISLASNPKVVQLILFFQVRLVQCIPAKRGHTKGALLSATGSVGNDDCKIEDR